MVREKSAVVKLFEILGPRYAERQGGYTRIMKLMKVRVRVKDLELRLRTGGRGMRYTRTMKLMKIYPSLITLLPSSLSVELLVMLLFLSSSFLIIRYYHYY